MWKCLFENPGVVEVHELLEVFVHSEKHSLVHQIVTNRSIASGDNLIGTTVKALAKAARCRTFPDGLFSVYCSQLRGCASSMTSSSICFNINGLMLSPTPRGSGDLLGSSTARMIAGEALAAAGSGCKITITAML